MAPWFGPLLLLDRGCCRIGTALAGPALGGWAASHSEEPYLLSSVCH